MPLAFTWMLGAGLILVVVTPRALNATAFEVEWEERKK